MAEFRAVASADDVGDGEMAGFTPADATVLADEGVDLRSLVDKPASA